MSECVSVRVCLSMRACVRARVRACIHDVFGCVDDLDTLQKVGYKCVR